MKKYVIYAGVNGAGKSTLYNTNAIYNIPRVNSDEILREFGDWKNAADMMKASKIAVQKTNEYMSKGVSFNQETTLCGHSILKNGQLCVLSRSVPNWFQETKKKFEINADITADLDGLQMCLD